MSATRTEQTSGEVVRTPPAWVREVAGWLVALCLAIAVAAHVAIAREELMFFDGDSLFTALFAHSLATGAPQEWALSPVLFVPEIAVYGVAAAVTPDTATALIVSAVVTLLALYGALRLTAGARGTHRAPVTAAILAHAAFCVVALLESGGDRNSLQLASLLALTTYYSGTVIGTLLIVGIVRRIVDRRRITAPSGGTLAAVVALSCFSNPIVVLWALLPTTVVVLMVRVPERRLRWAILIVLAGPAAVGLLLRGLMSGVIVADAASYLHPDRFLSSAAHFAGLAAAEWSRLPGVLATLLVLGLIAAAVLRVVRPRPAAPAGARALIAFAAIAPVTTVAAVLAMGADAARYLQPAVFAAVLVIVAEVGDPGPMRAPWGWPRPRARRLLIALTASLAIVAAVVGAVRLATRPPSPSATSVDCVVDWMDATGTRGAGQFWTVRAPKAYLSDPAQLLQVTAELQPYTWLVNRSDYRTTTVDFLLTDDESEPLILPSGRDLDAVPAVDCGRYTIHDFRAAPIAIG